MSDNKVEATFHGARWSVIDMPDHPHAFAVAIVDEGGHPTYTHPIGFTDVQSAHRAAARLNEREAGIAGVPVPTPPEEEARAARLARIAELRGKRDERAQ